MKGEESKLSADGLEVVGYCDPRNVQKMKDLDICGFMVHDEPSMAISAPVILLVDAQRLLAQRDADLACLRIQFAMIMTCANNIMEKRLSLESKLASIESQQAASVGGEREAFEAWFEQTYTAHKMSPRLTNVGIIGDGYADSRVDLCYRGWQARAALSPAGGGVVMPELNKTREQWQKMDAKLCADHNSSAANFFLLRDAKQDIERLHSALCRLNAKPQANSQEAEE